MECDLCFELHHWVPHYSRGSKARPQKTQTSYLNPMSFACHLSAAVVLSPPSIHVGDNPNCSQSEENCGFSQ